MQKDVTKAVEEMVSVRKLSIPVFAPVALCLTIIHFVRVMTGRYHRTAVSRGRSRKGRRSDPA
jgi:hypothetical protein